MSRNRERNFFVKRFVVGLIEVNCYLVADPATGDACLIDPGGDPLSIKNFLKKNNFNLKFIINTHGHGDHIAANSEFDAPIYIHRFDSEFLTDAEKNLSHTFFFSVISPVASRFLEDGEKINLGSIVLEIIHTPGHTPGSISIKAEDVIFTGDALFRGSVGRTDFSYGDGDLLLKSIREKLLKFDDDTIIYPGHGDSSTIGIEKRTNPFLT